MTGLAIKDSECRLFFTEDSVTIKMILRNSMLIDQLTSFKIPFFDMQTEVGARRHVKARVCKHSIRAGSGLCAG